MARFAPAIKDPPNSLAEVFDAAWVVVGRRAYNSTMMNATNFGSLEGSPRASPTPAISFDVQYCTSFIQRRGAEERSDARDGAREGYRR